MRGRPAGRTGARDRKLLGLLDERREEMSGAPVHAQGSCMKRDSHPLRLSLSWSFVTDNVLGWFTGCASGHDFAAAYSFSCFSSSHLTGILHPGQYPE